MNRLFDTTPLKAKRLTIPLSQADVDDLEMGDIVYLDGPVFTSMTKWHQRAIDQKVTLPFAVRDACNVMMHVGPAVRLTGSQYSISALSPLVSMMFARWTPAVLGDVGVRAIIGKSGMQNWVVEQGFKKHRAVFLLSVGTWIGALYANCVVEVRAVYWLDLGLPEATWVMEMKNFGPFLVETDTRGQSFYEKANSKINQRLKNLFEGHSHDFVMKRIGEVDATADIW